MTNSPISQLAHRCRSVGVILMQLLNINIWYINTHTHTQIITRKDPPIHGWSNNIYINYQPWLYSLQSFILWCQYGKERRKFYFRATFFTFKYHGVFDYIICLKEKISTLKKVNLVLLHRICFWLSLYFVFLIHFFLIGQVLCSDNWQPCFGWALSLLLPAH